MKWMVRAMDAASLGARVQEKRERLNLTRDEFAARIGTSRHNLRRIEEGGDPSVDLLRRICSELQVGADELLFGGASDEDASWMYIAREFPRLSARAKRHVCDTILCLAEIEQVVNK